jgi:hypothetical protein
MDSGGFFSFIVDWAEAHPGLAGWIGIAAAILAGAMGWYALRFEGERAKSLEFNAQIDRFREVITRFHDDLDLYLKRESVRPNSVAMSQLANMTVLQWPSARAFESFHAYWKYVTKILEDDREEFRLGWRLPKLAYHSLDASLSDLRKQTPTIIEHLFFEKKV